MKWWARSRSDKLAALRRERDEARTEAAMAVSAKKAAEDALQHMVRLWDEKSAEMRAELESERAKRCAAEAALETRSVRSMGGVA